MTKKGTSCYEPKATNPATNTPSQRKDERTTMPSITLYTNPMSRGRTARWMLEEVGQPYDVVVLDFGPSMKTPEYLAINPMGKVPALKHGDSIITECAAICTYLADAFPEAKLMPENRASFYRWMFFAAGPVNHAMADASAGIINATEQQRGHSGYGCMDDVVRVLSQHLTASPYVCGQEFSAADVYLGDVICMGIEFGMLKPNDVFTAYANRIRERPARARAVKMDTDLMPKQNP